MRTSRRKYLVPHHSRLMNRALALLLGLVVSSCLGSEDTHVSDGVEQLDKVEALEAQRNAEHEQEMARIRAEIERLNTENEAYREAMDEWDRERINLLRETPVRTIRTGPEPVVHVPSNAMEPVSSESEGCSMAKVEYEKNVSLARKAEDRYIRYQERFIALQQALDGARDAAQKREILQQSLGQQIQEAEEQVKVYEDRAEQYRMLMIQVCN